MRSEKGTFEKVTFEQRPGWRESLQGGGVGKGTVQSLRWKLA